MDVFESLATGKTGPTDILTEEWRESLHLEFKTLSDSSGARINREDRKIIAKALCGFCNADGGVLIIGVETKKQDGLDIAARIMPVDEADRLASLLAAALPELLQPATAAIDVRAIQMDGEKGIVVVKVGKSNDRPFMSIPAGQFFRRTFDNTRLMDRSEVRDLFLVSRDSSLKANLAVHTGASTGSHYLWLDLVISLQNEGNVVARAPYVITAHDSVFRSEGPSASRRRTKNGRFGFFTAPDALLHIDDEMFFAIKKFGLQLRTAQASRQEALARIIQSQDVSLFSFNDGSGPHSAMQIVVWPDETIQFGAANAMPSTFHIKLSQWDVLALVAAALVSG
jgi:Putative DNA-binding domain